MSKHKHDSVVSHALARNRVGTFGVGMSIASSVAPLTAVAGIVTTALAVTGLRGISIAMIVIAAVHYRRRTARPTGMAYPTPLPGKRFEYIECGGGAHRWPSTSRCSY